MSRFTSSTLLTSAVLAMLLAGCSGGSSGKALPALPSAAQSGVSPQDAAAQRSGDSVASSGAAPVDAAAAPLLTAKPSSLSFNGVGAAAAQTVTISSRRPAILSSSSSSAACATVVPQFAVARRHRHAPHTPRDPNYYADFTVTPAGAGSCTIGITDRLARNAVLNVPATVTPASASVLYVLTAYNTVAVYSGSSTAPSGTFTITPVSGDGRPAMAVDPSGGNLFVTNMGQALYEYPAAASSGAVAPSATITMRGWTAGIAADAGAVVYAINGRPFGDAMTDYATAGAQGTVTLPAVAGSLAALPFQQHPASVGAGGGMIAVGASGCLDDTCATAGDYVNVYNASDLNGTAVSPKPAGSFSTASLVNCRSCIAVDAAGGVYVAAQGDNTLSYFAKFGSAYPANPTATVALSTGKVWGVTVDRAGVVYVLSGTNNSTSNSGATIARYAPKLASTLGTIGPLGAWSIAAR